MAKRLQNKSEIKWLFFDMGSTLVDETQSYKGWFRNASQLIGGALSADEIERGYCAGMAMGAPTITGQLKPFGFTGTSATHVYPTELDKPFPEAEHVLKHLADTYRLGIIANQNAGAESRLEGFGLLRYFDVIVASAEAGLMKPDTRIYTLALERAGCEPGQAVMIGDRLDNDIFPAKALGFTTVRVLQGYFRVQKPKSPEFEPDFTIDGLAQLLDLFNVQS